MGKRHKLFSFGGVPFTAEHFAIFDEGRPTTLDEEYALDRAFNACGREEYALTLATPYSVVARAHGASPYDAAKKLLARVKAAEEMQERSKIRALVATFFPSEPLYLDLAMTGAEVLLAKKEGPDEGAIRTFIEMWTGQEFRHLREKQRANRRVFICPRYAPLGVREKQKREP